MNVFNINLVGSSGSHQEAEEQKHEDRTAFDCCVDCRGAPHGLISPKHSNHAVSGFQGNSLAQAEQLNRRVGREMRTCTSCADDSKSDQRSNRDRSRGPKPPRRCDKNSQPRTVEDVRRCSAGP
jgi:hypothetical protein